MGGRRRRRGERGQLHGRRRFGELVVNCTAGAHSLEALERAGRANLTGKVLGPADHIAISGGISSARGTEMCLALWLHLFGTLGTGYFNIKVVQ